MIFALNRAVIHPARTGALRFEVVTLARPFDPCLREKMVSS
jgi:hypothetical protein